MIELRGDLGLGHEARELRLVDLARVEQQLHRHGAQQLGVVRLEHPAHAAGAQLLLHDETADRPAARGIRGRGSRCGPRCPGRRDAERPGTASQGGAVWTRAPASPSRRRGSLLRPALRPPRSWRPSSPLPPGRCSSWDGIVRERRKADKPSEVMHGGTGAGTAAPSMGTGRRSRRAGSHRMRCMFRVEATAARRTTRAPIFERRGETRSCEAEAGTREPAAEE